MNITILLTSVRDNRLADSVYKKVTAMIGDRFSATLVDPIQYKLPLINKRYFEMKDPEPVFTELHNIFEKTDGFIIITAEYNHSIPPALTNMLNHYLSEFRYKACGLIGYSTGALGGVRCVEQLRLFTSAIGMPAIPTAPTWAFAHRANETDGQASAKAFEKNFGTFLEQFIWYTEAFMDKRKKTKG